MWRKTLLISSFAIAIVVLVVFGFVQKYIHQPLSLVWKICTGMNLWHVCFMPDGKRLIGGNSQQIVLWDGLTGWRSQVYPIRNYRFALSPKGDCFAVEGSSDTLELWDLSSGRKLWSQWTKHWGTICKIAFSPDSQYVATCGSDGLTIKLWRVSDGKLGHIFWIKGVLDFTFSPEGQFLAISEKTEAGYIVRLWSVASKKSIVTLSGGKHYLVLVTVQPLNLKTHINFSGRLDFSPDGRILVQAS